MTRPTLDNGHLQGPVTLTPVASGAVTTGFNNLGLSRPGIEPQSPAFEANALTLRHRLLIRCLKRCWGGFCP